jgi:hypothetical protein
MSVDYKYKPDKHKFRTNNKTIDELHQEHLEKFRKNRENIPEKKSKLASYKNELEELNKQNTGKINLNLKLLNDKKMIENNIKKLEEEIKTAENFEEEMNYYSRAGDVIYDYYNITNGVLYNNNFNLKEEEEKKTKKDNKTINISDELLEITMANKKRKLKKPIKRRNKKREIKPKKTVMSYLLGSDDEKDSKEEEDKLCKAKLENEYLIMVDKDYACSKAKKSPLVKCKTCNIYKVLVYTESILSCPKCGKSEQVILDTDTNTNSDVYNEKPKYPYKRIGHCIEKLNQFLCKGNTNIPPEVFYVLNEEIKKHSLSIQDVSIKFIEKMLKKHMMSEHYENIMYIYSKITGIPPKTITREEYELILKMFLEADELYEKKYKPKTRNNFLKYTFVLNKIFLSIGKPDHAKYFKLLKSPTKMKEQESIWKLICDDKGWDYYGS